MSAEDPRILIATDNLDDAGLVRRVLKDDFPVVRQSTDPDRFTEAFDAHRPQVLILAFQQVEAAQRYYLGIYRTSPLVADLPHRTLMLCGKDDVARVYALCCKETFDDYVLFWPLVHDAPRLPMSVRLALRALETTDRDAAMARIASKNRRIRELEAQLDGLVACGGNAPIDSAPDGASADAVCRHATSVPPAGPTPGAGSPSCRGVAASTGWQIADGAPRPEATTPSRAQVVMVVDDDEFMRKLLARFLTTAGYQADAVSSVAEMMQALDDRRPDLILMDLMLPGIDGIVGTLRLKALPDFADIPVIMLTGENTRQCVVDSLQAGAVDYVVKPFGREALLKKIQRRIGG